MELKQLEELGKEKYAANKEFSEKLVQTEQNISKIQNILSQYTLDDLISSKWVKAQINLN